MKPLFFVPPPCKLLCINGTIPAAMRKTANRIHAIYVVILALLAQRVREVRGYAMDGFKDNFFSYMYGANKGHETPTMDAQPNGYKHPDGTPCRAKSIETCPFYKAEEHKIVEEDKLSPDDAGHSQKTKTPNYRQQRDALASKVTQDGTYDLATGNPVSYESGYQVSFQEETTERKGHGAYITDDEYDRKVEALMHELGSNPDLGRFGEPEISFHVDSYDKAMEVARRFNQESIYDWSTHGKTFECKANPDFVGRTHYADRDNHIGKNYHEHKKQNH